MFLLLWIVIGLCEEFREWGVERERDRVGEEGFLGAIKDGCKHGVDLHAREIGGAYGLFF